MSCWRFGQKWVAESGFQARHPGCRGRVLNHYTVLPLWTLLIQYLVPAYCTPGIGLGASHVCALGYLLLMTTGLQMRDPHRELEVSMQMPAGWLQSLAGHRYTCCLSRWRKVLVCTKHAKDSRERKQGKPVIEGGLFKAHPSSKYKGIESSRNVVRWESVQAPHPLGSFSWHEREIY